jgi:ADP-heptose:LPS heptosyltransferase/glycosyltransferase involved in cell wall biosynthesis
MSKKVGDLLRDQARVLEQTRDIRNKIVEDCIISVKFKDETIHHILPINPITKNQLINDLLTYKEITTVSLIRKKIEQEILKLEANPDLKDKQVVDTLISLKFSDNTTHHVFPPNASIKEDLIEDLRAYSSNLKPVQQSTTIKPPEKIVFHNRQAIGDILTMTCAIRDFKNTFPQTKIGVITTASHIWDHNPYIDHSYRDAADVLKIGPGFLTNKSNQWNYHMCNAFRLDIQQKTGLSINQGPTRPDIWLTEEEYHREPLIDGPYWVIIVGGEPGWTAKTYPIERWQAIINALPQIKFIQLGMNKHPYKHLDNVIDYIGKTEDKNTGIRDLFNIFLHAQGSLGLVSMHMHLSAAFNNPCVVVAGAREPAWFTNYLGHQYIQTNGTMYCAESTACWKTSVEQGCKNKTENNLPKCVDIIQPEQVVESIKSYYKGGRLEYGKKVPNTFFKNISKVAKTFTVPPPPVDLNIVRPDLPTDLKFGGGSITDRDWDFIKAVIEKNNVKTILEFGAGLSTVLMSEKVTKIDTYETMNGWINKIRLLAKPTSTIKIWNGLDIKESLGQYDFAFVDGPSGGGSREFSTKIASEHANIVIIHDAGREPERKWQKLYLENNFDMISKGGHRCHLWMRKDRPKVEAKVEISLPDGKPTARMITTCRGYGGSERSSLFIMKMLLDKGYYVDLIPTGNISGEYQQNIPSGVVIKEWGDSLITPVDILVLYASDTIWNYDKPQYTEIMHKLQAKKKIMVLNYQLGGAGKVPWTLGWDKYMFLNSSHEAALIQRIPNAKTKVLAPPTDLEKFFEVKPNYDFPLRLIRHNSQGDAKHPIYTNDMISKVWEIDSTIEFLYMPARSDMIEHQLIHKYKRNEIPIPEFLSKGNCFWYHLPPKYTDGGPRVILEAFAAGLPAIVDNHSGPKDRVDNQTGWKCDNYNQYFEVIKEIIDNPEILRIKGEAAREKAKREFVPERWIEEILS